MATVRVFHRLADLQKVPLGGRHVRFVDRGGNALDFERYNGNGGFVRSGSEARRRVEIDAGSVVFDAGLLGEGTVVSHSVLDRGVTTGAYARIYNSRVGPHARLGYRCALNRADIRSAAEDATVLYDGVTVGWSGSRKIATVKRGATVLTGATLYEGCSIGSHTVIYPNVKVYGGAKVGANRDVAEDVPPRSELADGPRRKAGRMLRR